MRLRVGEGLAGEVAQRREGILVNDYQNSPYAYGVLKTVRDKPQPLVNPSSITVG